MKVTPEFITVAPTLKSFTVEYTPVEVQRLVGILGETYGRDADGLFEGLSDALDQADLKAIKPTGTRFDTAGA